MGTSHRHTQRNGPRKTRSFHLLTENTFRAEEGTYSWSFVHHLWDAWGKRKVALILDRNSAITFNSAFYITSEQALRNWTLNTTSVSRLSTRPEHTEAWRTFAAFYTNSIRRWITGMKLVFIVTTSGAALACSSARRLIVVCSFSALNTSWLFIKRADCKRSCRAFLAG